MQSVSFMDPNSQPMQAPVLPSQNQGLAALQMPGLQGKQGGMQFSPDQLMKMAEMLKGGGPLAAQGAMGGLQMPGGAPMQGPGMMMPGGFGGGMPMGGG